MQRVRVISHPAGANVTVNGTSKGTTPVTLMLSRWGSHTVRIEMPGYKPYERKIQKSTNGWIWGNILVGGLIGLAVDTATGAIFELDEAVYAKLKRTGPAMDSFSQNLQLQSEFPVIAVQNPDPNWRKVGAMERM